MTIQHKNIQEADLHEPKGISTASAGTIYVADGSGSGTWEEAPGRFFGELYITNNSTATTLAADSANTKIDPNTSWDSGEYRGFTLQPDDGNIVLSGAGVHRVMFWCEFTTASLASGTSYAFKFAINGTVSPRTITTVKTTNGVDRLHVSAFGFVETSGTADVLSMYVAGDATSSGTNITIKEAGLLVEKMAD